MFDWLKKLWPFGGETQRDEVADERREEEHYYAKQAALKRILGPMDDIVGHAIIPFAIGGAGCLAARVPADLRPCAGGAIAAP